MGRAMKVVARFVPVALLFFAVACSASPPSDGCAKDTDCASGRICGSDGKCADRTTATTEPGTPTSDPGTATSQPGTSTSQPGTSTSSGRDCHAYFVAAPDCGVESCECGTKCITLNFSDRTDHMCGNSCAVDQDCVDAAKRAGVDPAPHAVTCSPANEYFPSFCVWHF